MNILKKFKNELVEFELVEVFKNIFAVKVDDRYDRAMLFLRFQEYYESPFEQFRGKDFDIFEYMKFYQTDRKSGMFTYTNDWTGYNIPSYSIESCMEGISTQNSYDKIMSLIYRTIREKTYEPFYLLGVDNYDGSVMRHEIAHGLFYVNEEYKNEMLKIWSETPDNVKKDMRNILLKMGYCDDVVTDEAQAYFSTGLSEKMIKLNERYNFLGEIEKRYKEVFEKFMK